MHEIKLFDVMRFLSTPQGVFIHIM